MAREDRALLVVDHSFFCYYVIYGACSEFKKQAPEEASYWLKPAEEVDQANLPDLLGCETFKKILRRQAMKRIETLSWLLDSRFGDKMASLSGVDVVFAMDDATSRSFRKELYPQYKAQRKLTPRQFDMGAVRNFLQNVVFKDLELEDKHGYRFVKVPGAEGDDVVATVFKSCSDGYALKILIASDHDFLQLEGVEQLDMFGREIKPKIGETEVSPADFLLGKILLGDGSDNIPKVFAGIGPKRVMPLIRDRQLLRDKLEADAEAARRYLLNKKLVAFSEIPAELSEKIRETASVALWKEEPIASSTGFENLEML